MHHILNLIKELAIYEKELESVEATEEKLLTTLGFNPQQPGPAYARTLLLFSRDDESMSCSSYYCVFSQAYIIPPHVSLPCWYSSLLP